MKRTFLVSFICFFAYCNFSPAQTEEEVKVALSDWEHAIRKTPIRYDGENLKMLGDGLRKLSRRKSTFPAWRWQLYLLAQDKMISIPGHAEYFAAEVERLREAELERKPGQRVTYDRWRAWYLRDTLQHMPSPETVKVLGRYLHDERDTPPSIGDSPFLPENAYLSCAALANMGLRAEPPLPDSGIMRWRHDVDEIRAWYAKVASGEIPFSFKGQAVEYRFKPDGTWETSPIADPPDDGLKIPAANLSPERVEIPDADASRPGETADGVTRYLYIAFAALVVLVGSFFGVRRFGHRT